MLPAPNNDDDNGAHKNNHATQTTQQPTTTKVPLESARYDGPNDSSPQKSDANRARNYNKQSGTVVH